MEAGTAVASVARWRQGIRQRARAMLAEFVRDRCAEHVRGVPGAELVAGLLGEYVAGGKYLRSTFAYIGWLCGGAGDSDAALRAAASMELLHAFALLQDDVMDASPMRRGRATAHVRIADWHRARGQAGDAGRFGESAAILLGDLCLVWAEQMLRESGLSAAALGRAWPYYDALRGELAVGQFADLFYDARRRPAMADVLDMTRRKSGNYTVRRPLELGAALAGCDQVVLRALAGYGELVGEAFQLRDDLLGVFGSPAVTGKPDGGDLRERKATSVVVLAGELATPSQRERLDRLCARDRLTEAEIAAWRGLIEETGAVTQIERMIENRATTAWAGLENAAVEGAPLDAFVLTVLRDLAIRATDRVW
ncbi:MAG TPA: polyprenyl synthetase family protein [Trebonia sp.]|jgi:geranylgeranyl diphosphate synthase type I|nr:polyprenyl synthetase family protein [Trebonia sp.]